MLICKIIRLNLIKKDNVHVIGDEPLENIGS